MALLLLVLLATIINSSHAMPYPNKRLPLNPIDACWRNDPNWAANRRSLASCAVGFGKDAIGGKFGTIYKVTDASDDPEYPKPGTLRFGVIQAQPLWIVFAKDMVITPKRELMVNSFKTIDGRGAKVEIANGPCITIQNVSHVIIHGISIHDCKPAKPGRVRSSVDHCGERQESDGDAISIFTSSHIWIDHCSLARCTDGLIDVIHASTAVTISNNYFSQHDKVILLGHNDEFTDDRIMRVTVAFNRFGDGLVQRMPRVRHGYAHVANNWYNKWQMYAMGGSADPSIFSQGNYFIAPDEDCSKQVIKGEMTCWVTKREVYESGWKNWKWRSSNDVFFNGAYFIPSGWGTCTPFYTRAQAFPVAHGSLVPLLTDSAGALSCAVGKAC